MHFEAFTFNIPNFSEYVKLFGYLGIFLFFVTIDQITFIPEEITLLTIGYLSSQGVFDPILAGCISLLAFVSVDSVYFYFTKKGRKFTKRIREKMGKTMKKMEERLKTNFPKTLFVLCFIPRMRLLAPIISGALDVRFKKFLIYDSASLLLFTATYISLGVIFHAGLHSVLKEVETLQHVIFAAFVLVAGIFIIIGIRKFKKEKYED